jgi:hypothetical protein
MADPFTQELLDVSRTLLEAIVARDWETYRTLCDPTLTAFEPEARGELVEGLPFHEFYFTRLPAAPSGQVTMCAPHVRRLSADAAVVSYVRLVQSLDAVGAPRTSRSEETRVWVRRDGAWRHVHFHRSAGA